MKRKMSPIPTPTARVTLRDIAARVGLTPAAVSMALAGSPRISDKTKAAVREAAADLGYVPSSAGRALRRRRSGAIAVVVPNTTHHVFGHLYFMHVLTGVASVANRHDAQLLVATNADEADGITAYERVLRSQSADGAIVTSAAIGDPNVARLTTSGLPVVLIGSFPELPDATSIWIDDVAASRTITRHLIEEHDRRRLVHVTGPLDHQTGVDRRDGFLEATREAGIDGVVVEGDFSEESGAAAIAALQREGAPFDGVVFANDDMAFGGMRALRAAGLEVPADVAVVGFDDFGLARSTTPGITTVHVPAEEMAREAAELLVGLVAGDPVPAAGSTPAPELRIRESCGCRNPG
ncbi:LacI family DNA-binding transcriptional regulator [Pseudolysinimonas sp.]|uniref:LacI family DNA-binding transcriptional regulator n=1 Tax=Pseudolysinimonas sp. TaxID=2680009 RepID=UPI003F7D60BE